MTVKCTESPTGLCKVHRVCSRGQRVSENINTVLLGASILIIYCCSDKIIPYEGILFATLHI